MRVDRSKEFTGQRSWDAVDIAHIHGATVRLHSTQEPYRWHVNEGEEVFVVLDRKVHMHHRTDGREQVMSFL